MTDKDRAVNCDIVAEEVRIVSAEGEQHCRKSDSDQFVPFSPLEGDADFSVGVGYVSIGCAS